MAHSAPGKHFRTGLSFMQIMGLFPNDRAAEQWLEDKRWHNGATCPKCGSRDIYTRPEGKRRNQPHRCRTCKSDFSVKTDTLMHKSNIGYRAWAAGIYLMTTSLKGVSSMKMHRDLGITQKSAWMMMHKIRESLDDELGIVLSGPIEVDEACFGGKRSNMSSRKRKALKETGRGSVGKTAVVGIKDREANEAAAQAVNSTDADTLQGFVAENTDQDAQVYTDGATA
ncbi:MAG: IS1595 family transposase [Gammaproteobacteria bacterium]|nr:IS1595 family transposase [Gammaproteobacteria bacterium]MCY4226476.1 IS1595 family transposase [Gammaproteobacteria bacterium]